MAACARKEEITEELTEPGEEMVSEDPGKEQTEEEKTEEIYVYVCGAVNAPGVYRLSAESRVFEAIEAAGGMSAGAASDYLNQAEMLSDGQQIYVPGAEEAAQAPSALPAGEEDGKVNLNTAGKEELMTLSGIGEVKAEAVIRYREEHGGFDSVEELKQVEGIKDGVYNQIKDKVRIK